MGRPNANERIADESVYVDSDGKQVAEGDPKAAIMVVAKGGIITEKIAKRYNLAGAKKVTSVEEDKKSVLKTDSIQRESKKSSK